MRVFVAADLQETIKEDVSKIQQWLKKLNCDVKWVENLNLHLTLKFIGEVEENRIPLIKSEISKAISGIRHFDVKFSKLGLLPNTHNPRVIFIDIKSGSEPLKKAAQLISEGLVSIGIETENRGFLAHLTIGRFRSSKNIHNMAEYLNQNNALQIESARIEYITLFNSILRPEGPTYKQIERFELCG